MTDEEFRLIHEHTRLKILAYLASSTDSGSSFQEIRSAFGFSAGNLSIQLKKLEEAGIIESAKTFVSSRPMTKVSITQKGRELLSQYIEEIERILSPIK